MSISCLQAEYLLQQCYGTPVTAHRCFCFLIVPHQMTCSFEPWAPSNVTDFTDCEERIINIYVCVQILQFEVSLPFWDTQHWPVHSWNVPILYDTIMNTQSSRPLRFLMGTGLPNTPYMVDTLSCWNFQPSITAQLCLVSQVAVLITVCL